MGIVVTIADRLYDFTDEEKATNAVGDFQSDKDIDDETVLAIWADFKDPLRLELETALFEAVDANGTAKRAAMNVPNGVRLEFGP